MTAIMSAPQFAFAHRFDHVSGSAIREIFKTIAQPGMISFAGGNPSPAALPDQLVSNLAQQVLAENGKALLQYGATEGYAPFLESLKEYVRENKIDVGFAFDGDADRCLAVDENGNEVNGDKIMYICAKYMKSKGQLPSNTVVTTVMSNFGLYKALDRAGINYEKTAVGDRYVYENMKAYHHLLGGEQSGHIIFRKHARTGDGLITAIMLMEVMIDTQLPLSVLADGCVMYPQVLKNVVVDDKDETLADQRVMDAVNACTDALGNAGRVLLRKSGTEPVLRVMSEADTEEACEKYVNQIIDAMKQSGHLIEVRK